MALLEDGSGLWQWMEKSHRLKPVLLKANLVRLTVLRFSQAAETLESIGKTH